MVEVKEKSPGLAAVLSFIIWGLGQIYVGRTREKTVLGVLLLIFDIFSNIIGYAFLVTNPSSGAVGVCIFFMFIGIIITILIVLDAYKDAKKYNEEQKSKSKMIPKTILSSEGEKILQAPQSYISDIKEQLKKEEKITTQTYIEPEKRTIIKKKPKFCPECGNKLEESRKFCPECGNKL